MVDVQNSSATAASPDPLEAQRRAFAEAFALTWAATGESTMDGRVLGYVMIMRHEYISSADLAAAIEASTGAVSMSTRRLVEEGFIRRRIIPGDRNHYFYSDEDVWGHWLANERRYIDRQRENMQRGMDLVEGSDDPGDQLAFLRVRNGRDYMRWLREYHYQMLEEWQEYKAQRDAAES
jgi:DNA-binding transcriptional regulator GbsR (MarR family)